MNRYDIEHIVFVEECLDARMPAAMRYWADAFSVVRALLSSFAERSS